MAGKEGVTERKVAVITGASSGIGMATALELAGNDYNVVLAARRMDELKQVARQCEEIGVEALAVQTDVSKEIEMKDLCTEAVESFGRIDVWINDAGVYLAGKFEDTPVRDMRRLMDVNFFGYVYGSQAALEQFREQGYGTLINIASVNASAPQPYISVYGASKAAIRALDESIRMELMLEGLDDVIQVCTVMPSAIDTNLFQNGANYSGRKLKAIEPVYDPAYIAKRIRKLTENPKREKYIGPVGTMMALQRTHMPGMYERQMGRFTENDLLADEELSNTSGNLYDAAYSGRGMRGGWREKRIRADRFNLATGAVAAALIGLIGFGIFMAKKQRTEVSTS
jgi:short-subunit dehydrogenase